MSTPNLKDKIRSAMRAPHQPKDMSIEEYLDKYVKFPVLVSPKIDGIRCLFDVEHGIGWARSYRLIQQPRIQDRLRVIAHDLAHENVILDGELVTLPQSRRDGPYLSYHTTQSFVNTGRIIKEHSGIPWKMLVFDSVVPGRKYTHAINRIREDVRGIPNIDFVTTIMVDNMPELLKIEDEFLRHGYEGLMLRDPRGWYKDSARCTLNEGLLFKLCRTEDVTVTILRCVEAIDEKKNPLAMLGSFYVRDESKDIEYYVGAGQMTHDERTQIWFKRINYEGRKIISRSKPYGVKELPRSPRFVRFAADKET